MMLERMYVRCPIDPEFPGMFAPVFILTEIILSYSNYPEFPGKSGSTLTGGPTATP